MIRKTVVSSNIQSVGYDSSKQVLEIEFKGSGVYRYYDVPEEEYSGLLDADSIGKYFYGNIRDRYTCVKQGGNG